MGLTWAGREASQTVCSITRTPQTLALVAGIASRRSSATLVPPGRKAASQPHQLHPRDRLPNLQVDASFSPNPCPERPECINYMVLDDPTRKVKYTTLTSGVATAKTLRGRSTATTTTGRGQVGTGSAVRLEPGCRPVHQVTQCKKDLRQANLQVSGSVAPGLPAGLRVSCPPTWEIRCTFTPPP